MVATLRFFALLGSSLRRLGAPFWVIPVQVVVGVRFGRTHSMMVSSVHGLEFMACSTARAAASSKEWLAAAAPA
jgi:hypothetical protein